MGRISHCAHTPPTSRPSIRRAGSDRAAASIFADLREGVRLRDAFGHDEGVAQRKGQQWELLFQPELDPIVVERLHLIGDANQRLHGRNALRGAQDRGDTVLGAHRRAVMEDKAVAQRQAPSEPVGVDLVTGDHLGTWI